MAGEGNLDLEGTRSKHVYFVGVALFLVTVAFLVTDGLVWQPGVTEANVRRIRPGMTQAQVETLLGRPHDDKSGRAGRGPYGLTWYESRVAVTVSFSAAGRVEETAWLPMIAVPAAGSNRRGRD